MELNNYRTANSPKKKVRKITASATIVFCILSLIIGIVFGSSSGSDTESPNSVALQKAEQEIGRLKEENDTLRKTNANLKQDLADAHSKANTVTNNSADLPERYEPDPAEDKNHPAKPEESDGSILKTVIIVILIIVIIVCILFVVSIFLRKNDSSDKEDIEEDDEFEEADYEEFYEDDDEGGAEYDEDSEDDDEEYIEDDDDEE